MSRALGNCLHFRYPRFRVTHPSTRITFEVGQRVHPCRDSHVYTSRQYYFKISKHGQISRHTDLGYSRRFLARFFSHPIFSAKLFSSRLSRFFRDRILEYHPRIRWIISLGEKWALGRNAFGIAVGNNIGREFFIRAKAILALLTKSTGFYLLCRGVKWFCGEQSMGRGRILAHDVLVERRKCSKRRSAFELWHFLSRGVAMWMAHPSPA